MNSRVVGRFAVLASLAVFAGAASAVTIAWNTFTSSSVGSISAGPATVGVSFATTNPHNLVLNNTSWSPASTFADAVLVANAPTLSNGIMRLIGGTPAVNTITFSVPVVDPVFTIWSLGNSGQPARFDFVGATPILVAGGPSQEWAGQPITIQNSSVLGTEGNGTVRFVGTVSSISWTNPVAEDWYGFNVGISAAVPEPSIVLLLLAGIGIAVRRAIALREH
jgi:hypothetical protein